MASALRWIDSIVLRKLGALNPGSDAALRRQVGRSRPTIAAGRDSAALLAAARQTDRHAYLRFVAEDRPPAWHRRLTRAYLGLRSGGLRALRWMSASARGLARE